MLFQKEKKNIERYRYEAENAEREGNYGRVAELRYGKIPNAEQNIENIKAENDTVICVMSGNFMQRGDAAILPKSERTAAALKNGADLVIELPVPYSMSYAERFAKSSVYLLKSLGMHLNLLNS